MSRIRESTRAGDRHAVESGLRHRIGYRLAAGYLSVLLLLGAAWAVAASGPNALHVRFSHTVQEGKRLFDRFRAASESVMRQLDTDRRADFQASLGAVALMNAVFGAIFLCALGRVGLIGWLTTRAVTQPLARLRRAAVAIGRGELARPVEVAGAHEFALLAQSMDQMRRQLNTQHRLAAIIGSTLRLEEVYAQFAAGVRELVSFERLSLSVVDGAGTALVTAYATGLATERIMTGMRRPIGESLAGYVARTGECLVRADMAALPPSERFADEQVAIEAKERFVRELHRAARGGRAV